MFHATEIGEWPHRPGFHSIASITLARAMTADDVPWFIGLCRRRYPPRSDKIATEHWMRTRVLINPATHLAMRTDRAACVTVLNNSIWFPSEWEAQIAIIIAEDQRGAVWETLKLLRFARDWAQRKGCIALRGGNATEHDVGPLLRRIGAVPEPTRYQCKF